MLNKFKLFLASIVVVNLISLPVKSQARCPYQNFMIGPNNNCIDLDALSGSGRTLPKTTDQTPSAVDDNGAMEESTETSEEPEKSIEEIQLTSAIEDKQNSIALIQENNETMKQQIEISCAKQQKLDQRKFCLKQKNTLGPRIEENQERIISLEEEIEELEKQVQSLSNNPEN